MLELLRSTGGNRSLAMMRLGNSAGMRRKPRGMWKVCILVTSFGLKGMDEKDSDIVSFSF